MENHLTPYLTNETSFLESWIKRLVFIIVITMYYLFDRECDKVYVIVVNEEKQKNEGAISFWWYCKG